MSAAINVLRTELEDQRGKLKSLQEEHKPAIDEGRRAERIVGAQARHVQELVDGIAAIEQSQKGREVSA